MTTRAMRWMNDIYVSTPYRVLLPRTPRFSLALFLDPNPDAAIEALPVAGDPECQPVKGAECLNMRLDATCDAKIAE